MWSKSFTNVLLSATSVAFFVLTFGKITHHPQDSDPKA